MDKKKIIKYAGIGLTAVGGVLLFITGAAEDSVMELVGGIFLFGAIVSWMIE